ncbi:MAG: threonine ammonia-lyase [Rhodospirillales bacterium]
MDPAIDLAAIEAAAVALKGHVVRTPTVPAPALSRLSGAEVFLKLENLQATASFKVRGAYIKLAALADAGQVNGVVAASAGNHAQGVAYHAQALGLPATIVMPADTPFSKISRTEALGAHVMLFGDGLAEARAEAQRLEAEGGLAFIHPYDDPLIITGQGTVGLEMLTDVPDLDILVVPIGGGGLMAGTAVAAKAMKPDISIIGVEAEGYASMSDVLAGRPSPKGGPTIAEGIAVKEPGVLNRSLIEPRIDDIIVVPEVAIERAVQDLAEYERIVAEGAAATAWAAIRLHPARFEGKRVGAVISGGNMDSRLLASILLRGLVYSGRIAKLRIEITDKPGALAAVTRIIGEAGGNIVEVVHQRMFHNVPVKLADLDVVVETRDKSHVARLLKALAQGGYSARLLSSTSEDEWL